MSIEFTRPYILLAIPAVIALLVFSMRLLYVRSKAQKISYIVVRSIVAVLLLLALSGFNIKLKDKYTATVFLIDVSDSVKDSRKEMIDFINDAVKTKGKYDNVGVIAFGEGALIEQFLTDTPSFNEVQTTVIKSSTNLENAVLTGLSMIPDGYAGRIVLLTDGVENAGTLKNTISSVITNKCLVEVKSFQTAQTAEVYVSNLEVPSNIGTGEKFMIKVEVESNIATSADLYLYAGRTLKERVENVKLIPGTNYFAFSDTQSEEGLKTYKVLIECEDDSYTVNNEYVAYTNISVNKPLLIVEGKSGASAEFVKLLNSLSLTYNVVLPVTVPNNLSELNEYSAVVFIDVYATELRKGFLDILESYVRDFAGGFITTGGKNSYALGCYKDTVIEDILPVYMDLQGENEIPTIAMTMVIDHSGSMSAGQNGVSSLELAKEAAIAALENLRDTDYVGVIAFDDSFDRVVPLQKCTDRNSIESKIASIRVEGGTSIYPALEAAVKDLEKNDATVKHIVLLTDGEDGYAYNAYLKLLKEMNDSSITLSTVAVGQGCNSRLLTDLADEGKGRYYYTDGSSDIPRIFAQEVFLSVNSYINNRTFTPGVAASNPLINDVVKNGLPQLLGYIGTSTKPRATQLLVSDTGEPILSVWQYGLGKTVAFTPDVQNLWTANYAGWANYQLLWHNLLDYVTAPEISNGAYAEVSQAASTATIKYVTENFTSGTTVTATVADDKGNITELKLDPLSPGIYTSSFDMADSGVYSINLKQYDDGEITSSLNTAAVMQYSLEYRFYDTSTVLEDFVKAVGGNILSSASEVFNEELDLVKRQQDISTGLLVAAIIIFMLDIAVRRFRINIPGRITTAAQGISAKTKGTRIEKQKHEKPGKAGKQTADESKASPIVSAVSTPVSAPSASPSASTAGAAPAKPVKDKAVKAEKDKAEKKAAKKAEPERLNTSELMKHLRR